MLYAMYSWMPSARTGLSASSANHRFVQRKLCFASYSGARTTANPSTLTIFSNSSYSKRSSRSDASNVPSHVGQGQHQQLLLMKRPRCRSPYIPNDVWICRCLATVTQDLGIHRGKMTANETFMEEDVLSVLSSMLSIFLWWAKKIRSSMLHWSTYLRRHFSPKVWQCAYTGATKT